MNWIFKTDCLKSTILDQNDSHHEVGKFEFHQHMILKYQKHATQWSHPALLCGVIGSCESMYGTHRTIRAVPLHCASN